MQFYLLLLSSLTGSFLSANPSIPDIQEGLASFHEEGASLTVTQRSDQAIIHWDSFSIEEGEVARFIQPNSESMLLNRVTGGDRTNIYGSLESNGKLYLINEEGFFIGPGGSVKTGYFLASTLDLSNEAFLKGKEQFFQSDLDGSIINKGFIQAVHGDVILLAKSIDHCGEIEALKGQVVLGGSTEIYLQEAKEKRIQVKPRDDGEVINDGVIKSLCTEIGAGGSLYSLAINQTGLIEAFGALENEGKIVLHATEGRNRIAGTLAAKVNKEGGTIHLLGEDVFVDKESCLIASGESQGGEILVGGGFQGKDSSVPNAKRVSVAEGAEIDASAIEDGHGGKVIIWGNFENYFFGKAQARGGVEGGNGGLIEVSSPLNLVYKGEAISLGGPGGVHGKLLLDPSDITIATRASNPAFPTTAPGIYNPTGASATLEIGDIQTALGLNHVLIKTSNGSGGVGSITVNNDVVLTWAAETTLSFEADREIIFTGGGTPSFTNTYSGTLTDPDWKAMEFISCVGGAVVADFHGIHLHDVTFQSTKGNISLEGKGGTTILNKGVFLEDAKVLSIGTGDDAAQILLTGNGGAALQNSVGLSLDGAQTEVSSYTGNIQINGTSFGTSGTGGNSGVVIANNAKVKSMGVDTSAGLIAITGSSGDASNKPSGTDNHGIVMQDAGTEVRSINGDITFTGESFGLGGTSSGILMDSASQIVSTGTESFAANITFIGDGSTTPVDLLQTNLEGISLGAVSITSDAGAISMTGKAGKGNGIGVKGDLSQIVSSSGNITIIGDGGTEAATGGAGVLLRSSPTDPVITSQNGAIQIIGTGKGVGPENHGIGLIGDPGAADTITSTGTGAITFTGVGSGTESSGVVLLTNASVKSTDPAAAININATGLNSYAGLFIPTIDILIGGATTTAPIELKLKNGMDLTGVTPAPDSYVIQTSGSVQISPIDNAEGMGVGDSSGGAFRVDNKLISVIDAGKLILGHEENTAMLDIKPSASFSSALEFKGSSLNFNGDVITTTGNIVFEGDSLNFDAGIASIQCPGSLTFQPRTDSTTIGIADGGNATFSLENTHIAMIHSDVTEVIIGKTTQDSLVDIRAGTYNNPLTIYGKKISLAGAIEAGAHDVTFHIGNASSGTLDLDALVNTTGDFAVNGGNFGNDFNVGVIGQTASFDGGDQPSTLNGPDETKTWTIIANNGGSVGPITFTKMNRLVGKSGDDTFVIGGEFYVSGGPNGGIYGGGGTNSLQGPDTLTAWTIKTADNQGEINPNEAGATSFTNIASLQGGLYNDTFVFEGAYQISGGIDGGGAGTGILKGADVENTWTILGDNQGSHSPKGATGATPFMNMSELKGGSEKDTFIFNGIFNISDGNGGGVIDGGLGVVNEVRAPDELNLWTISGNDAGFVQVGLLKTTLFTRIQNLTGGASNIDEFAFAANARISGEIDGKGGLLNTVSTADLSVDNTWRITGADTGTLQITGVTGTSSFKNIGTIAGGTANDTIIFEEAAGLTGLIAADSLQGLGSEHNVLDYRENSVEPNIVLFTPTSGLADNITLGFSEIQEIIPYGGDPDPTPTPDPIPTPEEVNQPNREGKENLYLNTITNSISTTAFFDASPESFMVNPFHQYSYSYMRFLTNGVIDMSKLLRKSRLNEKDKNKYFHGDDESKRKYEKENFNKDLYYRGYKDFDFHQYK